jgi:putative flavoprotein involved in K+ transport
VEVERLVPGPDGDFMLHTSDGPITAATVVLATGAYQRPHRPKMKGRFGPEQLVIDVEDYANPGALPQGPVLVVGSGQTGCQLAEELQESGREVFMACGRAPWLPRRASGRDLFRWLAETTFFDVPLSSLPSPLARLGANPQMSGHGGGHDLHHRTLQKMGVHLHGHLIGVDGHRAIFAPDLMESVAAGDARYLEWRQALRDQLGGRGMEVPELPDPPPFAADPPTELNTDGFGAVVFTSGFRPDFARWVHFPAFDDMGFPLTSDCASTVVPGLYFAGNHFLRKRKSSLLLGVGEDASLVARAIAGRRPTYC